jgi:hypothetical protein
MPRVFALADAITLLLPLPLSFSIRYATLLILITPRRFISIASFRRYADIIFAYFIIFGDLCFDACRATTPCHCRLRCRHFHFDVITIAIDTPLLPRYAARYFHFAFAADAAPLRRDAYAAYACAPPFAAP